MSDNNRICELYQKKAKELIDSRFSKNLKYSGVTVSATPGQPVKAERKGPDLEAIKSFAITYRNFALNTDPISIQNIAKMYEPLPKENRIKKEFSKIRQDLNNYLDSPTNIYIKDESISRKRLIDTYIYGQVIHLEHNEEFEKWISVTPFGDIIYDEIVRTLTKLAHFIVFIDSTNQDLLKQNQ